MNKEEFLRLLDQALEDENGNLYFKDKISANDKDNETHRVYFGTITTICEDLIETHSDEDNGYYEVYDRHFWNDDTLEIKIVNKNNKNGFSYDETAVKPPIQIKKINIPETDSEKNRRIINIEYKINELIDKVNEIERVNK